MKYSIVSVGMAFSAALMLTPFAPAVQAACPGITLSDMKRVKPGTYPQIFEKSDYEKAAGCKLTFSANPESAALNARIRGNPSLPALSERLPEEPLVVVPYNSIGKYGGTLDAMSVATESGTSDFLSTRHVNLVRYADDLQTLVPNVAKSWDWNSDFTRLTLHLRRGHKWSDGAPFTSADVKFWYENLLLDNNVFEKTPSYALVGGEPMTVSTPSPEVVVFNLPAPKSGLLLHFATAFSQGYQPKHFLGRFHPEINPDADALAREAGFESGYEAIKIYYGNSDWTDTPSPLLTAAGKLSKLPADVVPTLESHIIVAETAEGRHLVANPYFFQVDSSGQQLPYISEQDEVYVTDAEVRLIKLINGDADYKSQSVPLDTAPVLLDNRDKGDFSIVLKPTIAQPAFAFNQTSENPDKRAIFSDLRFRKAMSIALNREEINEVVFFGQGSIIQYTGFSPQPDFVDKKWLSFATEHDQGEAKRLLDQVGLVDKDGDGFRDLPNGGNFFVDVTYSTQSFPARLIELMGQNWGAVGIKNTIKEVTSEEYRSAQSANKLDVAMWVVGEPLSANLADDINFVPPFSDYFGARTSMLWAEWFDSNGSNGVEPPAFVKQMRKDITAFQSAVPGSSEFNRLGASLTEAMASNLILIGTVLAPAPIYRSNKLQNFADFKTSSYEYYRTYPYLPGQWWLDE